MTPQLYVVVRRYRNPCIYDVGNRAVGGAVYREELASEVECTDWKGSWGFYDTY